MIKVLIADDHAVVRKGIVQILSEEKDIEVLGEASSSEEVLAQLYDHKWDLIILDLIMPGKSGLDTLIQIKQRIPDLKVLVLSMHPEEEIAIRVLKSGASGYLKKDSVPEELIKAIRKVNGGGKYISSTLAESIFLAMDKDISKAPHEELSEREFQVLCLIATGNSLSDIGKELSLSVKTISTYRTRVLEKLKLKTNIDLTHYAIKHKLIVSV